MSKLVSIVVPIYNVEEYLDECIRHIVDQTHRALEIILVDDGATDSCPAICDRWAAADSRIRVIHKQNAGLGMARNSGMDAATGEYIFFLDSDDYVDTALVEKCLRNAAEVDADVVIFGYSKVYADGRIEGRQLSTKKLTFQGEEVQQLLLPCLFTYELGFGVSACAKMFRLQTLKGNGLRFRSEREIISEDSFFALELFAKAKAVSVLPECLYFYRKRENSLSRSFQPDRQPQNDIFLTESISFVRDNNLPDQVITHLQARYHGFTLGSLMQTVRSGLPKAEKRRRIREIYHNDLLRSTLTEPVCKLDARLPRLFWRLLRLRLYPLCTLLLHLKAHQ